MRKIIIVAFFTACLLTACSGDKEKDANNVTQQSEQQLPPSQLKKGNIQHTVQFNLKWDVECSETEKFLQDGKRILSALPTVQSFEALRQVSTKNNYKFYFTMVFENQEAYDAYNNHPDHVKFVKERWETEVTDFLEGDFIRFE
ncbi:MAG: Dabb family protein [Dysgonomonas sp.]